MDIDLKEMFNVSVECLDSCVVFVVSVVVEVVVVWEVVVVVLEKFDGDCFDIFKKYVEEY